LVTCVPISAEIGTRCACAAGVTVRDGGGPATAACAVVGAVPMLSVQADNVTGTATRSAAVTARRARARVDANRRSVGRASTMGPSLAAYVTFVDISCPIRLAAGDESPSLSDLRGRCGNRVSRLWV